MKTKSGFKYVHTTKFGPVTFNVFFKTFNDKIVKCWVREVESNKLFVGIAKCNTDLDAFDEEFGMKLALKRALDKRTIYYRKKLKAFTEMHVRTTADAVDSLMQKLHNNIEKGKLTCKEKIKV